MLKVTAVRREGLQVVALTRVPCVDEQIFLPDPENPQGPDRHFVVRLVVHVATAGPDDPVAEVHGYDISDAQANGKQLDACEGIS